LSPKKKSLLKGLLAGAVAYFLVSALFAAFGIRTADPTVRLMQRMGILPAPAITSTLIFNHAWDIYFVWDYWNPEGKSEHFADIDIISEVFYAALYFPTGAGGTLMLDENGDFWGLRVNEWIYLQRPEGLLPSTGLRIDIGSFALTSGFFHNAPLEITNVYGTEVTAYIVDYNHGEQGFWATFTLEGHPYTLVLEMDSDDMYEFKTRLTDIVRSLVLNPPDLGVLMK